MKRSPGYYWVCKDGRWFVAYYARLGPHYVWHLTFNEPGSGTTHPDDYFALIDETPIVREGL